jgi:hypothetical protein
MKCLCFSEIHFSSEAGCVRPRYFGCFGQIDQEASKMFSPFSPQMRKSISISITIALCGILSCNFKTKILLLELIMEFREFTPEN